MIVKVLIFAVLLFSIIGCSSGGRSVRPSFSDSSHSKNGRYGSSSKTSSPVEKKVTHKSSAPKKTESVKTPVKNKGSDIEPVAKNYIGTRYKYGGTTSRGFDCSGYVWKVYQDMGYSFSRASSQSYYQKGEKVSSRNARKGDLVFFKERGRINHVGIYLGDNRFIHASSSRGVIESSLINSYWKPRVAGFRRYY